MNNPLFKKDNEKGNFSRLATYFSTVKQLIIIVCLGFVNYTFAQDMRTLAKQHYVRGEFALSVECIEKITDTEACDFFVKANALQKLGRLQEASLNYNEARSNGCRDSLLLLNNGICEYSLGHLNESIRLLKLFTHENNDQYLGYYWLASAYYLQHKYSKSRNALETVFSLNDNYAPAYFLDAAIHKNRKQFAAAAETFLEAYARDSTLKEARMQAAIALLDLQKYEEALSIFKSMTEPNSSFYVEALYYSGESSYLLKENDDACSFWKEAADAGDFDSKEIVRTWCENKKTPIFKNRSSSLKF